MSTRQGSEQRNRRQEARRQIERRQQQRRLIQVGALGAIIVATALVAWWILGDDGEGTTSGQALHQFTTADFHSLAFDPEDADTIYFGHHNGLKVSYDGGESWDDAALQNVDAMQLAVPGGDSERMYAAGHDVFYVSTDGGETWNSQPNNLPGLDLHAFTGSPSDAMRLYTSPVGHGIFTSSDGGETWHEISMPPGGARAALALEVAPDDPLHVYAGIGSRLAETIDGGETWQELDGPPGIIISLAAAQTNPPTLYAGTDQGLFKRVAGRDWEDVPLEADTVVIAVAVSPTQPERIAVVDSEGRFYRSDDGGTTWED